jgi:hypothetical protein
MAASWSHRIVRDEKGLLHFAAVRFREFEDKASGMLGIFNEGRDVEAMRRPARPAAGVTYLPQS